MENILLDRQEQDRIKKDVNKYLQKEKPVNINEKIREYNNQVIELIVKTVKGE